MQRHYNNEYFKRINLYMKTLSENFPNMPITILSFIKNDANSIFKDKPLI